ISVRLPARQRTPIGESGFDAIGRREFPREITLFVVLKRVITATAVRSRRGPGWWPAVAARRPWGGCGTVRASADEGRRRERPQGASSERSERAGGLRRKRCCAVAEPCQ